MPSVAPLRHVFAVIGLVVVAGPLGSAALAERGAAPGTTAYYGQNQCGIVDVTRLPPRAYAQGDVDRDGVVDHFYANWGGVERHRLNEGASPPTLLLESRVYTSTVTPRYSCVDLRLHDLDSDGDVDLAFASPREVVVLENRSGRFTVARREGLDIRPHAAVVLQITGGSITVRDAASPR